uniref:Uncharacterized protein n=1 Tax=viral metagenome TaxID=1070528 RepID=A0A6C0F2M5_9ZZZZ
MNPPIVFTRYLYIKEEVAIALLISVLEKRSQDECLFWTYELYYSGFQEEIFQIILKIYYDFFATLNPSMESYILVKYGEWKKAACEGEDRDKIPGLIVVNMLTRPFNMDVFALRQIVQNFDIDENFVEGNDILTSLGKNVQMIEWLEKKDYENISKFVLEDCPDAKLDLLITIATGHFNNGAEAEKPFDKFANSYKKAKKVYKNTRHLLLAKILTCFSICQNLKMGKNVYAALSCLEINIFKTKEMADLNLDQGRCYKTLPIVCRYNIDCSKRLGLFSLGRKNLNLKEDYWYHWEYYASFSPIWQERLARFKGVPNGDAKRIDFENDDWHEEFYDRYALEPDEQKKETQDKNIQEILQEITWKVFYDKYASSHLLGDIDDYLNEMETVKY